MIDISTLLCGVTLDNPTVLPAGILGVTAASLERASECGAGAVTTKSIGPVKRSGHPAPVVVEVDGSLLNAVGLSCPDIEESLMELKTAIKKSKSPVIASIYGRDAKEFGRVAERIGEAKPHFIEANISCPNIEDDFGKPFGVSKEMSARVTGEIKDSTDVPLIVKLSPNTPDLKGIARAVEDAGADAISAINTLGPGMAIDIVTSKPVLSNKAGGMSGSAVRPVAVRCVYDIYESVEIPIIGMGGAGSGRDAVEFMMAGARAVGIGTAVWKRGLSVYGDVCCELAAFMEENGYSKTDDLVGIAHS